MEEAGIEADGDRSRRHAGVLIVARKVEERYRPSFSSREVGRCIRNGNGKWIEVLVIVYTLRICVMVV